MFYTLGDIQRLGNYSVSSIFKEDKVHSAF